VKQREDLMRDLHRAGLRLDDAALAAGMAVRRMLDLRNRLMRRAAGFMSVREIADLFGVAKSVVHRIVNDPDDGSPMPDLDGAFDRGEELVARIDALLVAFRPVSPVSATEGTAETQTLPHIRQAGECRS
jgi:hypothetical protein